MKTYSEIPGWLRHRTDGLIIGLFFKQGEAEVVTGIYKFKARKNTLFVMPSRVIASSKNWAAETAGICIVI